MIKRGVGLLEGEEMEQVIRVDGGGSGSGSGSGDCFCHGSQALETG